MFHVSSTMSAIRRLTTGFVVALAMTVGLTTIGAAGASAAPGDGTVVGKSTQGKMLSKVVGSTSAGDKVTGTFTPTRFVTKNGKVWAKGFLAGVITDDAGHKTRFSGIEKMSVEKVNGLVPTARALNQRAACDILHLVLGPLDLDLLGLQVHLDRVVLDIIAVTGAGNLLGNLLCAVTGLLDGGPLAGLLGQLQALLNQILGALNLGV
jgi:hypothetical protein